MFIIHVLCALGTIGSVRKESLSDSSDIKVSEHNLPTLHQSNENF